MKYANRMTDEKLTHWAEKTVTSINNGIARGRALRGNCEQPLITRFNRIMRELKKRRMWSEFCESMGVNPRKDGDQFKKTVH
jgi:hypothetical protein